MKQVEHIMCGDVGHRNMFSNSKNRCFCTSHSFILFATDFSVQRYAPLGGRDRKQAPLGGRDPEKKHLLANEIQRKRTCWGTRYGKTHLLKNEIVDACLFAGAALGNVIQQSTHLEDEILRKRTVWRTKCRKMRRFEDKLRENAPVGG